MAVLFLDFDGVVLDSAGETAITAWRGGQELWPREWSGDMPPQWLIESFRSLRPLLHTGYEAFGLLRLAWLAGERQAARLEPSEENRRRASELLTETGVDRERLVELFGSTRDHWLRTDFQGWLQANRFYPGVAEMLKQRLRQSRPQVYILTTKQERFVFALAEHAGFKLERQNVFGLDTGRSKKSHLLELVQKHKDTGEELCFIEDRLPTLEEMTEEPRLNDLRLRLADWGYVTPDDVAKVSRIPRISSLSLDEFLSLLDGGD